MVASSSRAGALGFLFCVVLVVAAFTPEALAQAEGGGVCTAWVCTAWIPAGGSTSVALKRATPTPTTSPCAGRPGLNLQVGLCTPNSVHT
jgi:hypothetical protein